MLSPYEQLNRKIEHLYKLWECERDRWAGQPRYELLTVDFVDPLYELEYVYRPINRVKLEKVEEITSTGTNLIITVNGSPYTLNTNIGAGAEVKFEVTTNSLFAVKIKNL